MNRHYTFSLLTGVKLDWRSNLVKGMCWQPLSMKCLLTKSAVCFVLFVLFCCVLPNLAWWNCINCSIEDEERSSHPPRLYFFTSGWLALTALTRWAILSSSLEDMLALRLGACLSPPSSLPSLPPRTCLLSILRARTLSVPSSLLPLCGDSSPCLRHSIGSEF